MQLRVVTDQPWDVAADVLVIPFVGEPAIEGAHAELDRRSGGELAALAEIKELRARRYTNSMTRGGDLPAKWLLTVSAGDGEQVDNEVALRVAATAERRLAGRAVRSMAIWLSPIVDASGFEGDLARAAELAARGVVEGSYDPKALYRPEIESKPPELDELILVATGGDKAGVQAAAERGVIIGEGANTARTLGNRAANEMYPEVLADEARAIAERNGLWIDVIDDKQATELGMGMFMAVGRGSDNPPRMIVMRSGEEGQRDKLDRHLAIVGKGVCFDSGGISIKPSDRMEEMKMDKAGACTVIAAIETVARLSPGRRCWPSRRPSRTCPARTRPGRGTS